MSDLDLTTTPQPSRQQLAARGRTEPGKVTGKLKVAIEAMVWDGLPRSAAAAKAGMTEHGLYKAFRKPPVKAFYLAELEVLRTSERARNIHRAIEIRDKADNMPAFNALRWLHESDADQAAAGRAAAVPGLVIVVQTDTAHMSHMREIDGKSLISQEDVPAVEVKRDE